MIQLPLLAWGEGKCEKVFLFFSKAVKRTAHIYTNTGKQ
jgi:hypothetical protein